MKKLASENTESRLSRDGSPRGTGGLNVDVSKKWCGMAATSSHGIGASSVSG